jgi:gas vesicle protein
MPVQNEEMFSAGYAYAENVLTFNYVAGMFLAAIAALSGALIYVWKYQNKEREVTRQQFKEMHEEMVEVVKGNKDAYHELKAEIQLSRQTMSTIQDILKDIRANA